MDLFIQLSRGIPIISTVDISAADTLIVTVLVIDTDNQRSQYKCQYGTCKLIFI